MESLIVPAYKAWAAVGDLLPQADKDNTKDPKGGGDGGVTVINPTNFKKPDGIERRLGIVLSVGMWMLVLVGIGSVVVISVKIAVAHKNGAEAQAFSLVWPLIGVIVGTTASGFIALVL
ncbi:MAG: hypothetical protein HOV66_29435 [Streptomycetaceae bacterium]|jgi:hypothetical protein|nr:hypothetical protein [Streptomycetaceae bacterium]NUS58946.1 hypothetical protein [Streptomycetaceae bacterium]